MSYLLVQEISTSGSAEILRNNLAGSVRLKGFSAYLKWSEIGNINIHLLKVSIILVSASSQKLIVVGN